MPRNLGRLLLGLAMLGGLGLRAIALDRLPGINADEAWYGVNVEALLAGDAPFLRTGVGNPLNPLHSIPLLALSTLFQPSMSLLRVPSVIWGFAAIACAFPILVRPLGARAAIIATILMAILPTAVAYSRLGWDPSDTPFVALLAVGFALGERPVLAAIALVTAMAVHPTNIFLAPIVAASWAPVASMRYRALGEGSRRRVHVVALTVLVLSLPLGFLLLGSVGPDTSLPSIAVAVERVVSPSAWLDLMLGVVRLFSGVTIARDIGGPVSASSALIADAITMLAFAVPIAWGWKAFAGTRFRGPWLLAAIGLSLALFHAVAGPDALRPGYERYGMFLLSPLVILCAIGFAALAERAPRTSTALTAILCASLLAVLAGGYFSPLVRRGGDTHQAFRTGEIEPKVAAYAFVQRASTGAVEVIAEDWWLYWPLKYLSSRDGRIHVTIMPGAAVPGGLRPASAPAPAVPRDPEKRYAVVFHGSDAWSRLTRERPPLFVALDPVGRPILDVVEIPIGTNQRPVK